MEDENIVAQIPPALLTDTRLGFGFFGSVVPPLCIFGNSPDNVNNYMCHRRQPYLVDNPTQLLNTFNSNAYSFFETSIFRNRDDNFFNIFSDARQKVTTVIPGEDEWGLYYPGLVWRVRSAGTGQLRVTVSRWPVLLLQKYDTISHYCSTPPPPPAALFKFIGSVLHRDGGS